MRVLSSSNELLEPFGKTETKHSLEVRGIRKQRDWEWRVTNRTPNCRMRLLMSYACLPSLREQLSPWRDTRYMVVEFAQNAGSSPNNSLSESQQESYKFTGSLRSIETTIAIVIIDFYDKYSLYFRCFDMTFGHPIPELNVCPGHFLLWTRNWRLKNAVSLLWEKNWFDSLYRFQQRDRNKNKFSRGHWSSDLRNNISILEALIHKSTRHPGYTVADLVVL